MKRKLSAEFIGTAMLDVDFAQGKDPIMTLANAVATGCLLCVIRAVLDLISVSLVFFLRVKLSGRTLTGFFYARIGPE